MEAAPGAEPLAELRADGGATANAWLMQFQADVLGVPVVVPEVAETTALGAAQLAGVGDGALTLYERALGSGGERLATSRAMAEDERDELLADWHRARRAGARLGALSGRRCTRHCAR